MEEFFLEAFLSFHELDVVYQEYVVTAVTLLELRELFVTNGFHETVHERFAGHIADLVCRIVGCDVITNGL